MKKLSVIIPVYNVEKFLHRCVDSVLNQTYKNLEVILVDDGSPDNSGKICDEYAKSDSRVVVVHQKNGGLSAARNAGMDIATGYYVAFLDSDDYISCDMYSEMIEKLEDNNLDIISCNVYVVKGKKLIGNAGNNQTDIFDHDEIIVKALLDFDVAATNKVYRKHVIENVRFPNGRKFEDTATVYLFFNNANKVGHINKSYYYYYRNPNSITQTSFNAKDRYDFVLGYIERLEFAKKHNFKCLPECKSLLLKAALSCLTAIYAANDKRYSDIYLKVREILLKYKDDDGVYNLLNFKYKLFLWSFNRADFIHKFSAFLSMLSKRMK